MTDIQPYTAPATPAAQHDPAPAATHRARDLVAWADEARAAATIAVSLAKTGFAGAFRGKPDEATAAILAGNEMGLSPMASLRAFDPIQGVPAMRANAMRGVVQAHGHEVWIDKSTATVAVACGRRADSDTVYRSEWTLDRAKGLGLLQKDNWRKQPIAMLVARATSEVCRLMASDVLHGIGYSTEELEDTTVAAQVRATKAKRRALEPVPMPEPTFPEPQQATTSADTAEQDPAGDQGDTPDDPAAPVGVWPEVTEPGSGVTA